ncbi:MAG: CerR family C-terminal domain-containing protein [Phycisphaerae bacterium]|nr:CerR family C-terminal domain-containing protein [Phycisphaerae bacterium]
MAKHTSEPAQPGRRRSVKGPETRMRLLVAAGEEFADRGFRDATIRDICRRARANIAAVNYHFGDKANLYKEALQYAALDSAQRYPVPTVEDEAPAREQLRRFVAMYLERMLDEERPPWQGKLMFRELIEPSGLMDGLADKYLRPQFERLERVIRRVVGPGPDAVSVRRAAYAVVAQCQFYKHARVAIAGLQPAVALDATGRRVLADAITDFSMAGLASLRGAAPGAGEGT